MYYFNNKQAQNPLCDWSCKKSWVVKTTRFGLWMFFVKSILNCIMKS